MNRNSPTDTNKLSFARIVQQSQYPTKDQAIILDSIASHSVHEYTVSLAKVINPANIISASRISHGRKCFYLNSKELVDELVAKEAKVNIGSTPILIRPLISKAKRIIISNVQSCIPHAVVEDELKKLNILPVSQITHIRAGMNEPGFSHIQSFRRQIYVKPEDVVKIPQRIEIVFDNTKYWIYLSAEKLACFLCKQEGHLAKHCKEIESTSQNSLTAQEMEELPAEKVIENSETDRRQTENTEYLQIKEKEFPPIPTLTGFKRPLSYTASTVSNDDINKEKEVHPTKDKSVQNKKKKAKHQPSPNRAKIEVNLQPAKEFIIENQNKYSLSYESLIDFIIDTYGKTNIAEVALTYTNDNLILSNMLTDIYSLVSNRSLKSRITKIKKHIISSAGASTDGNSSDFSDLSVSAEENT